MDETQLNDLKQFIVTAVSQATAGLATKADLARQSAEVNQRFDETLAAIAETMSNSNDGVDERLDAHEQRITKLEQ